MSTTTNWDDFKPIGNSPASSSGVNWGDFTPAPTRTLGGTARDVAVTALKGAVGLPQAVVGLADIPTGGRVGKALEGAGVRFKDAQDALSDMYSPAQQAANRKVQEADGFVGTAKAMLENPSTIATGIGESLPQMLGGAGVARGILKAAPKIGAVAAGALGEGVMGAGSAAEQIREQTADGLLTAKQAGLAAVSGAATAALGGVGGAVARRLGVGDVDTMLAQGTAKAAGQGSPRSMPRQIIEGGLAEGALEEMPQSVAEQALQNLALDRPVEEGLGAAAAQGLITGTAMGGIGGGVGATGNRAQQRAEAEGRQRTQAAIDSANALAQEARSNQPQTLQLGHSAPDRLYVFPDGTTGRAGEVESYLASLPEDQRVEARARLMGRNFTEVNDPQAQQARRWWENYREGESAAQGRDYLAEVQAAVRSGTSFTTRQTVDMVRNAMEDAWLAQNVTAEPATPATGSALQAADAIGSQLQGQFQQAGEDAGIAAVDARVRTSRILSGLQNLLDAGADSTTRVIGGLNERLARINEQPLDIAETQRVRRMVDAYMGFRGVGEAAPLPADRAPAVDPFADNAAMESLIPERPSRRMGIDPAKGALSRAAALAVDSGASPITAAAQEVSHAQAAQAPLAGAAESLPATRSAALEASGARSTTTGVTDGVEADQTQQASAQPAQAGTAQGAESFAGPAGTQAFAGASAPGALSDAPPAQDVGAQAAPQARAPAQAPAEGRPDVAARPDGWRDSKLKAIPVARSLGIDATGKSLAQVVAEIDEADARLMETAPPENPAAEKAGQQAAMDSSQSSASVPPRAQDTQFRRDDADRAAMSPELAAAIVQAARQASSDTRTAARRMSDERLVATQQLVDGLKEKWANAPEIIVARNMQDEVIPQHVRDYDAKLKSQGASGEPQGFILGGKVYLLSDTLQGPNHIATVLFHEVLGHWGLRRAFGDALKPILNQVALARRADVKAKANSYGLDWNNHEDRLIAAEEVLAEMAQTNPQLTLVQRAISAIRNWLRANVPGFKALRMTNQDIIQAFILPARGAVTRHSETMEQAIDRAVAAVRGDPRFSRSAAVAPAAADYTPEQARAAEHAFGAITKQTLAERAQSLRANLGTKLRQGIVDQFAPIKEVSAKAYMLARLSKGSDGAVEAALLYGKPFLRDGVYDVDMKDGGFAQVLAGLKGEHDRFFQWVAAQRAERLKAEGKENLLTDSDITALKSLNAGRFADGTPRMPAYAAALRDLNAFNEATLKVAMESGLIDQAAYDLMKDQPYVPFYRLMEEGDMRGPRFSSGLVNQQAWKKLKGGTQQINADLLQNTLMNWSHLYAAAARNRASLETMSAAEKLGIAYRVPADTKGAVKVMRDGIAEHWAVEDPYLLDAIMAMSYAPGGLVKAMAPFKRLLTFGVTVNPTFKIRNLIRDSLSAISQSDLSYNPLANVAEGWKATHKDSQTYASMLASGGIIKFGTQEDTNRIRAQIEKLGGQLVDQDGYQKLLGQMKSLWDAYEEFGDRTENVNRAALYERLRAKGHSHAEAAFMARDLMDFSMSGKWEVVRFLAQTVPFLNARLQGLYKLGRSAKEDPRRFAVMAGAVSMASLGLLAAYGDDEDWKKREDWDRDNYWWFKIGDTAFRVPKPFELGSIGTLAERTAELMLSEEMTGKRFGQRISDMVFNTFAMDPTPQFIKPFIDVYANKDSFSGRAIEGMADEKLRPQDRYNERTSEIARLLGSWGLPDPVRLAKGEYSALSPKQVDFLLRGYFGWLATVATTATDAVTRPLLDRGERPAMRLRDVFLAGNFVEQLPTGSSRYVSTMYEQARDIEQAWNSYQAAIKSGDTELAQRIQEEDGPKLRNRLAVNNAKRMIAELGQQAKRIEGDRLMDAGAKRRRLDEIEARKHDIAKRIAATS